MQVEHENKVWKERAKGLKGNYTDHSLQLIARYYLNNFLTFLEFQSSFRKKVGLLVISVVTCIKLPTIILHSLTQNS